MSEQTMTPEELREQVAEMIYGQFNKSPAREAWWKCAGMSKEKYILQADQILTLVCQAVEEVENPYNKYPESIIWELARQSILNQLGGKK